MAGRVREAAAEWRRHVAGRLRAAFRWVVGRQEEAPVQAPVLVFEEGDCRDWPSFEEVRQETERELGRKPFQKAQGAPPRLRLVTAEEVRAETAADIQRDLGFDPFIRQPGPRPVQLRSVEGGLAADRGPVGGSPIRLLRPEPPEPMVQEELRAERPRRRAEPQHAPALEVAIEVFFNARHSTAAELEGEFHSHTWRLRAEVESPAGRSQGRSAQIVVRSALEEVANELEGANLNKLECFASVEPGLESVAGEIAARVRARLRSLGLILQSTTVWDQPTQSVTVKEQSSHAA